MSDLKLKMIKIQLEEMLDEHEQDVFDEDEEDEEDEEIQVPMKRKQVLKNAKKKFQSTFPARCYC